MPKANYSRRAWVGIDPGKAGGIAAIDSEGKNVLAVSKFDGLSDLEISNQVYKYVGWSLIPFAVIEKVGGYVKGSGGNIGSAMFKFGRSCGFLHGCLVSAQIPYEEVTPQVWQKALGIPTKKSLTKAQHKKVLLQHAQRLFPKERITLDTADAVLIAEYCRRKHCGILES